MAVVHTEIAGAGNISVGRKCMCVSKYLSRQFGAPGWACVEVSVGQYEDWPPEVIRGGVNWR